MFIPINSHYHQY